MAVPWQWENATGAVAGFATVAAMHPLDVVRTRFQVNHGRVSSLPTHKNTAHAVFTIARLKGLRGLYAGFFPAVIGSTLSWGLYFFVSVNICFSNTSCILKEKRRKSESADDLLNSGDYAALGGSSKVAAVLLTYPFQVI